VVRVGVRKDATVRDGEVKRQMDIGYVKDPLDEHQEHVDVSIVIRTERESRARDCAYLLHRRAA
jgi:hypothetical protein